ncbi:Pkinase-domain-containing protein [Coniophora puteana RWD-64-598 SS2]|uniref:Pkinase-domain-containing protein n=1 Tax=Coniophora puteana (strain RWD-64-598) TaxID=741705 RepID=A0A5M3MA03_CONPW|nr:Pkinase-domain-containing protein [Coniophora puteana RWD-64-598 SS2]EIW75620.1 Pkinase-domain-containing protein [Coniophora puteana RWD-64-598 SS2]
MSTHHKHSGSISQNAKAQLANAYNELGKELSSNKIRVVGNYTLGKVIGEGAYGKVRMGTHRLTSTRVAIKQIPKAMSASLTREIHHHRTLHHPHITQMFEVIATEHAIWIVTELCLGGELFDYLAEKGRLAEDESKILFGQLCLAVAYLHDKGIVHRDLKLENVLLDERCRVKLGDFGFTREYERGAFMETFCGTTGYAAPEMLQGKKYLGPEVDIWSMGVILYTLLTGTLPFDDDDEAIMRDKVIEGKFEDPEWLSDDARELIRNVLEKDPSKRLTIPQILASPWFTSRSSTSDATPASPTLSHTVPEPPSPSPVRVTSPISSPITLPPPDAAEVSASSATSSGSATTFLSATSNLSPSAPTTPDDTPNNPFETPNKDKAIHTHQNGSQSTITKKAAKRQSKDSALWHQHETVVEEEVGADGTASRTAAGMEFTTSNSSSTPGGGGGGGGGSKAPPHPTRTPARTKRRSVSSMLSDADPASPNQEQTFAAGASAAAAAGVTPGEGAGAAPQDFAGLLSTPAPIIFTTPFERELLNSMSVLGLDTAQIVHSVLTDACDCAGALWWMLKRKAEKRALDGGSAGAAAKEGVAEVGNAGRKNKDKDKEKVKDKEKEKEKDGEASSERPTSSRRRMKRGVGVQTDNDKDKDNREGVSSPPPLTLSKSAPDFTVVPPTPTISASASANPTSSGANASGSSANASGSSRALTPNQSSTPSGSIISTKEKEKENQGSRGKRAGRSGSVSIMQRATTALEAAGLVRKKSNEGVREEREREREREKEREKERKEKEKEKEKVDKEAGPGIPEKKASGDDARTSHGSQSSKLTKSPPLRAKDAAGAERRPVTPTHLELQHPRPLAGSPWVVTGRTSPHSNAPSPGGSPGDTLTSLPNFSEESTMGKASGNGGPPRNRQSILSAFRFWFNEDRKGKRKEQALSPQGGRHGGLTYSRSLGAPSASNTVTPNKGSVNRRPSGTTRGRRVKRHSTSSRRSSSVNSRRSSGTSAQVLVLEHPPSSSSKAYGAQTPVSERGDYPSRPSSVHSIPVGLHHKSLSGGSSGSNQLQRASSPNSATQNNAYNNHRRGGSSSSTRVVRQYQTSNSTSSASAAGGGPSSNQRPIHHRSNSATSSVHSLASSRPTSFYEPSDTERTGSPFRSASHSRRSLDDSGSINTPGRRGTTTTFVAQKRLTPFMSPLASGHGSLGRTSWKKSWGHEPPGWKSRSTHLPIEVLAISPLPEVQGPASIRDVFTGPGRQRSLSVGAMGDESDWVDEDDDVPEFAGGLGQMPISSASGGAGAGMGLVGLGGGSVPTVMESTPLVSPPPRTYSKRNASEGKQRNSSGGFGSSGGRAGGHGGRQKGGPAAIGRSSPVAPETTFESIDTRGARRQLPGARSGPAAIQEEDEGEEE